VEMLPEGFLHYPGSELPGMSGETVYPWIVTYKSGTLRNNRK